MEIGGLRPRDWRLEVSSINWHLGTMGFGYQQWVGAFYPAGMTKKNFLAHYSQHFSAVEIDSTFYGIPRASTVQKWTAVTPDDFTFCLKTPKSITHAPTLETGVAEMQTFLEIVSALGDKLGVVLIQFGPEFGYGRMQELANFLETLPQNIRFAVEFRHTSWEQPETAELLSKHNICWTAADYIYMSKTIQRTTDFLYLRFIGPHGQFGSKDREMVDKTPELHYWHEQIQPHLPKIQDVYVFMNNDYSGFSPATCNRFKAIVGDDVQEIRPYIQQRLL